MKAKPLVIYITCLFLLFSCKKEESALYGVNDVTVKNQNGNKSTAKSTTEFISIAYADLYKTTISQSELLKLNTVYSAFGDKKLIEDRIIRNFLNDTNLVIPVSPAVNGDTTLFIKQTYQRFYNRNPNAFESYYLKEQIRLNTIIKPVIIYYSMMTGDEYRYY